MLGRISTSEGVGEDRWWWGVCEMTEIHYTNEQNAKE